LLSKSAFKIRTALNEKLNNSIHIRITSEPRLLCGRDPFEFIELDEYDTVESQEYNALYSKKCLQISIIQDNGKRKKTFRKSGSTICIIPTYDDLKPYIGKNINDALFELDKIINTTKINILDCRLYTDKILNDEEKKELYMERNTIIVICDSSKIVKKIMVNFVKSNDAFVVEDTTDVIFPKVILEDISSFEINLEDDVSPVVLTKYSELKSLVGKNVLDGYLILSNMLDKEYCIAFNDLLFGRDQKIMLRLLSNKYEDIENIVVYRKDSDMLHEIFTIDEFGIKKYFWPDEKYMKTFIGRNIDVVMNIMKKTIKPIFGIYDYRVISTNFYDEMRNSVYLFCNSESIVKRILVTDTYTSITIYKDEIVSDIDFDCLKNDMLRFINTNIYDTFIMLSNFLEGNTDVVLNNDKNIRQFIKPNKIVLHLFH